MKMILDKIQRMEENLNGQLILLGNENKNRAKEIQNLADQLQLVTMTEDGSSILGRTRRANQPNFPADPTEDDTQTARGEPGPSAPRITATNITEEGPSMKAKDVIRTIETLRGRDDVGVEDFIKSVMYARSICSERTLLLKLIIVEKITENAKRSIRYTTIETFNELYETLRQNVSIPNTVSSCRAKLQLVRQSATETIQSYNLRFRQQLNELMYAVQNKHQRPITRRVAIEEEEEEATRTYILNLRRDIGQLVIPSKPKTLLEAQTMAADMELWTRDANRAVEKINFTKTPLPRTAPAIEQIGQTTSRNQHPSNMPLAQRMQLKCTKCNRMGHTAERCYSRNFPMASQGKNPPIRANLISMEDEITPEPRISPESTAQPEDYYKYHSERPDSPDQEDYLWTQEQV